MIYQAHKHKFVETFGNCGSYSNIGWYTSKPNKIEWAEEHKELNLENSFTLKYNWQHNKHKSTNHKNWIVKNCIIISIYCNICVKLSAFFFLLFLIKSVSVLF